ncbi:ABC transporter substrate-binding protein [Cohnella sp. GCM10027633]|uniref:ABC transporter substrate-binding protein n=1 Tax=unclassified Cohnella TaxID=2636738 RepID=UPI00363477C1
MYATADRYLTLLNKFGDGDRIGEEVDVTVEDLAQALFCTARNVKIILRKLQGEGLIEWHAGRGRGNRSRIVFLREGEPLLLDWAQRLAREGDYKQAFEAIQSYRHGIAFKERFVQWLNGHFGYETEQADGKPSIDTLRFPVSCTIKNLDPRDIYYAFDAHIVRQLFDQLAQYEHTTQRVSPGLAHSWETNADATEWKLYLRKGIKFHHGREMTAEDVVFSFERLRGRRAMSWLVDNVSRIGTEGPRTVRIELRKPNRLFLRYLCSAGMSIVPKELVLEDEARFWRQPIGSGPFRVAEWSSCRIDLEANPDYYTGRAHLDRVVVATIPAEPDIAHDNSDWEKLLFDNQLVDHRPHPEWETVEELCRGCVLLSWNMNKQGPQQDYAFRRAIDLMIERGRMLRELGGDRMYPAVGYRMSETTPRDEDRFDPAAAEALLRQSGYDGRPILLSTYGSYEADARLIADMCAAFGVDVRVSVDYATNPRDVETMRAADFLLCGVVLARDEVCEIENYAQSGNFLRESFAPETLAWVESRVEAALVLDDADERRDVLHGIESRLGDEALLSFLYHKKLSTYVHPSVRGVRMNYLGWTDFKDIWLENRGTERSATL